MDVDDYKNLVVKPEGVTQLTLMIMRIKKSEALDIDDYKNLVVKPESVKKLTPLVPSLSVNNHD